MLTELNLDPAFLLSILKIIAIDILLGGDNAVVIALACRQLPDAQRKKGIVGGVAGIAAGEIRQVSPPSVLATKHECGTLSAPLNCAGKTRVPSTS